MTLITELLVEKGLETLFSVAVGTGKKLWKKGPVGRTIALLQHDFGEETGLQADDFFQWTQSEEIVQVIGEVVSGDLLEGEESLEKIADAYRPKLYRVDETDRTDIAMRMAAATFAAAPLVVEDGFATQYVVRKLENKLDSMGAQIVQLDSKLDVLISRDVSNKEAEVLEEEAIQQPDSSEPESVPTPEQVSHELPRIAEALFQGPLRRAGQLEAAELANAMLARGEVEDAAAQMESIASSLRSAGSQSLADGYLEWAADEVEKSSISGHEAASYRLRFSAIVGQIQRGSNAASVKLHGLADDCPDEEQWTIDALLAIDGWPEHPEEAVEVLAYAAEQEGEIAKLAAVTAIEILVVLRDFHRAAELGERFKNSEIVDLQTVALELYRLEALEELDAKSASGADVESSDEAWRETELAIRAMSPEVRGMYWQRRSRLLVRRGDQEGAESSYTNAVVAWSELDGGDEQASEALVDLQMGAQINGEMPSGWELRVLAVSARGSFESPVVIAERLEAQGNDARLSGSLPDALKRWSHALAIHRRWGNHQGELRMRDRLGELREHGGMPASALPQFIAAGQEKSAVAAAKLVDDEALATGLVGWRARWETAVAFEVMAVEGRRIPDQVVNGLFSTVSAAAREDPEGFMSPQPARSARKALAKIFFGLDEGQRAEALEILRREFERPAGIDTQQAVTETLILATNVGLAEDSEALVGAFVHDPGLYRISEQWVAEQIAGDDSLAEVVRRNAMENQSFDSLSALTLADLVAGNQQLEELVEEATVSACETITVESAVDEHGETQTSIGFGVGFEQMAVVARNASEETRSEFVRRLLTTLESRLEPEVNRTAAADGLFNMGSTIPSQDRGRVCQVLGPIARGDIELSAMDEEAVASTDPFSRFQLNFTNPERLRGSSLHAWARTSAQMAEDNETPNLEELERAVEAAISSGNPVLISSGLRSATYVPTVCSDQEVIELSAHPDVPVRRAAVLAWGVRGRPLEGSSSLMQLIQDFDFGVRFALIGIATEIPDGREVLEKLRNDPDPYLRRLAEFRLAEILG